MTHLKVSALLVGAVAFPMVVWLVVYFDAGRPAETAFAGAIIATVLFALIGLFTGTLKLLIAAANPLMGLLLAGEGVPIIFAGIFCCIFFIFEFGAMASVFPKINFRKCTMMCFIALWMAIGTFSCLAKAAVIPGLAIFCIGAVSMFAFEYVSERFKCFQDISP